MCCVGFLSIDSRVYAYSESDNFYPINFGQASVAIRTPVEEIRYDYFPYLSDDNKYLLGNPAISDISYIQFREYSEEVFTFPYNSDVYDYYLLGTVVTPVYNSEIIDNSTFKPRDIYPTYFDYDTKLFVAYPRYDTNIYNIDSLRGLGYGFSQRIDFESVGNTGIYSIHMYYDKDGVGEKPPNLELEFGIMAIEKGTSESAVLSQILNKLDVLEDSIVSSIEQTAGHIVDSIQDSTNQIADKLEDQFEMDENEDFGVDQIQDQVEQKLGVLNFGSDTLVGFIDLFSSDSVGDTTITFPGFNINVDGVNYNVWNDIEFDLSFLEQNFGILISAVRFVTVLCVWLAVLGYLVKAKDQIINNRG